MTMLRRTTTIAMMTSLLAGCGGAVDDDYLGDPLMQLHGDITNEQQLETPPEVGAALLWTLYADMHMLGPKMAAQETLVDAEFPAQFELSIYEPPPEEALFTLEELYWDFPGVDPSSRLAASFAIAYADGNGNGVVDMVGAEDPAIVDSVIGYGEFYVYYYEGDTAFTVPETEWTIEPGFNLVDAYLDGQTFIFETIPMDTPVTIAVLDDPYLNDVLCTDGSEHLSSADMEDCFVDGSNPACPDMGAWPADAEVSCEDGDRALTVDVAEVEFTSACVSMTRHTLYQWVLEEGDEAPAGWPC